MQSFFNVAIPTPCIPLSLSLSIWLVSDASNVVEPREGLAATFTYTRARTRGEYIVPERQKSLRSGSCAHARAARACVNVTAESKRAERKEREQKKERKKDNKDIIQNER